MVKENRQTQKNVIEWGCMDIKKCIAENIADLRKYNKMTQGELATMLNYSDKAISKWEHGEALPDIEVLIQLCNIFKITLNDIIEEKAMDKLLKEKKINEKNIKNKIVITCLSIIPIWFFATFIYIVLNVIKNIYFYPAFVWAVPASSILLIVFNGIWGKRKYTFIIVSILLWSLLASIYIQLLYVKDQLSSLWPIFLLGIPLQIAIILWSQIKRRNKESL